MQLVDTELKQQWEALLVKNPKLRIRNAANELGVTEVQLLALDCGNTVTRLTPNFNSIFSKVESLGHVMALSRNDQVVHERKGIYTNGSFGKQGGPVGLFVGEDIDLRMFMHIWSSAFAVTEMAKEKERHSLQFFSKSGEALHKIYLTNKSNLEAYKELVEKHKNENQSTLEEVVPKPASAIEVADSEIDIVGFRKSWLSLKDTHDFFGMLKKYGVSRTQSLRLAPLGGYAIKVDILAARKVFELAAQSQVPIMVFVGNPGIIQIHTGPVNNLVDFGPWFNVMDPAFNLHLKEDEIAECWVVRKPTSDGTVTSVEVFNEDKELIMTLFGKRKPGIAELETWRMLVKEVENTHNK